MKLLFTYCLIVTAFITPAAINSITIKPEKPNKFVFCWDIHDTLLKKNAEAITLRLKLGAYTLGCWESWPFIQEGLRYFAASGYFERKILEKATQYRIDKHDTNTAEKLEAIAAIFGKIELAYESQDEVIALLDALNACGYCNHIPASNIDHIKYQELQKQHPQTFAYFQNGLTVDLDRDNECFKPRQTFFDELIARANPDGTKTLIFIDDSKTNVIAARKAGIISFQYISPKQLISDLASIGITIEKEMCLEHV